jgi:hypothetical protein
MKMQTGAIGALLTVLLAAPAGAQSSMAAPCAEPEIQGHPQAYELCVAVAQAVESAQPQLGILAAGGNPTLGTASAGGMRFGVLPRVSATARLNLVFIRLPEILAQQAGGTAQQFNERFGLPAPALSGTVSVGVFPGFSPLPLVGGIGAIDVLGSATWLPFKAFDLEGFGEEAPDLAWGVGARVGLLRESFVMPGISASLMYRRLGQVSFGNVCPSPAPGATVRERPDYTFEHGACSGAGDSGEFDFDLSSWSTRLAVSKRLLGFGLTAGLGHDRHASGLGYGVEVPGLLGRNFVRVSGLDLTSGRTNAFVNASFTVLLATLGLELGWMQGEQPLPEFSGDSAFDPRSGTLFGSVGARLSF